MFVATAYLLPIHQLSTLHTINDNPHRGKHLYFSKQGLVSYIYKSRVLLKENLYTVV